MADEKPVVKYIDYLAVRDVERAMQNDDWSGHLRSA
jgi:hypothetical protein